jgi:hypothetical protein
VCLSVAARRVPWPALRELPDEARRATYICRCHKPRVRSSRASKRQATAFEAFLKGIGGGFGL